MANGYNPYEFVNFGRYDSAESMFNETMGFGNQNFYDYDNDSLLDSFPVRPQAPYVQPTSINAQPLINIPGGIGTYNAADAQFQNLKGPDLQKRTLPSLSQTISPATSEPGFGSRFAKNLSSPQAMAGMARGFGGLIQGLVGRGRRREAQIAAQNQYDDMLQKYRDLDTSNLYANVQNQYTNLENVYEDLTVNQQQAEFERDMFARQQADLLQNLSGVAGGSGIAGLAQALANQSQIAAQRSSASIGMQESRNQLYKAAEASKIQFAERAGEVRAEQMRLAGATQARALDYMKTGTELGMAQQDLAAKNMAIAQANASLYGGIGSLVGTGVSAALGSI